MQIADLTEEHERLYFLCLEDWSDEMKESGDRKEIWWDRMKDQGVRVKLGLDDEGTVGGMIQYMPIELSWVEGKDMYFIMCIWVHGYEEGRGNFQKKGMGKALLQAAEEDAKASGKKGIAAWGISLPFWMNASWFKKQGYKKVDKESWGVLLWKQFSEEAVPPKWMRQRKRPGKTPGKVTVTSFVNGWCPAQNIVHERAKRASGEFGDKVVFQEIDTLDREVLLEWGLVDGLYIDGEEISTGPPPSYEDILKLIQKRMKKLK